MYDFIPADDYPGTGFFAANDSSTNLWIGTLGQYTRLGFPVSSAVDAWAKDWGLSPQSEELDFRNQYDQPFASSETIRMFDVQRCIDVDPADIVPTGVAYELAHVRIPTGCIGIIEAVPTIFDDVTALDDAGDPIFSFGSLNGERLCRDSIDHPDANVVVPLTWQFALTWSDDPDRETPTSSPSEAYVGPVPPAQVLGSAITPRWTDMRYGGQNRWGNSAQYLFPSSAIARYWVVLRGPADRFRVRVGARIAGYQQSGGREGAALRSVLTRHR